MLSLARRAGACAHTGSNFNLNFKFHKKKKKFQTTEMQCQFGKFAIISEGIDLVDKPVGVDDGVDEPGGQNRAD